jgi:hypothetical protein
VIHGLRLVRGQLAIPQRPAFFSALISATTATLLKPAMHSDLLTSASASDEADCSLGRSRLNICLSCFANEVLNRTQDSVCVSCCNRYWIYACACYLLPLDVLAVKRSITSRELSFHLICSWSLYRSWRSIIRASLWILISSPALCATSLSPGQFRLMI